MLAPRAVQAFANIQNLSCRNARPSLIRTVLSYLRSIDIQLAKFSRDWSGLAEISRGGMLSL